MFKGSLCIYDNKVYIGNTDNLLRCLDAATGRRIWAIDTGKDLDSSPCVLDGKVTSISSTPLRETRFGAKD